MSEKKSWKLIPAKISSPKVSETLETWSVSRNSWQEVIPSSLGGGTTSPPHLPVSLCQNINHLRQTLTINVKISSINVKNLPYKFIIDIKTSLQKFFL